MMIKSVARNTLFSSDKRHNLLVSLAADAIKLTVSLMTGTHQTYTSHIAAWELSADLPNLIASLGRWDMARCKVPKKLIDTVNKSLVDLGGTVDKSKVPNFAATKRGSYENDVMYVLPLSVAPTADVDKLERLERNLEDRLYRAGFECNVRVRYKPARLEIDKAKSPKFALSDYWQAIGKMPVNQRLCVPAISFDDGVSLKQISMTGDRFSCFVGAASGYGKSQWALAQLLTLALLNSPAHLGMIVCDVKADDFNGLRGLPHLAAPILTEPSDIVSAAETLVAVMEQRKELSLQGDRSFKDKAILFFVDELADIEASLSDEEKKRWINAMQRLGQRGRSAGILIIGASQRAYEVSAKVHKKMNMRVVGHADANDATAAAARAGVKTDKLGPGSFELYGTDNGERVQGLFVADADQDDYENVLANYVGDIINRWAGQRAHFAINGYEAPQTVDDLLLVDEVAFSVFDASDYDTDFLLAVHEEMSRKGDISERRISVIHKQIVGTELFATKRKEVKSLVQNAGQVPVIDAVIGPL